MVLSYITRHRQGFLVGGGLFATLYGGFVLWKDSIRGKKSGLEQIQEDPQEAQRTKVFLVTGANSGIGRAVTSELAKKKNNKVYMLCRNMESCETNRASIVLDSGNKFVYCRPCDLGSLQSVRNCAKLIQEKEDRIDGLVNNAGIMFAPRSYTSDGIESHWAVNHLGHFLLTRLLREQLVGGRVLFMVHLDYRKASEGIRFSDINMQENYDKHYAFYQSQLANVLAVKALSQELKSDCISVNAVYPGIVHSTMIKRHMGVDKSKVVKYGALPFMSLATISPSEAADTVLFLLLDRSVGGETGKMYTKMNEIAMKEELLDEGAAKRVVNIGDYWSGLKSREELMKVKNKSAA